MFKKKKAQVGFSFVEVTLILIIFTSLVTTLIALAPVQTRQAYELSTEKKIKYIEKAVWAFYNAKGYLPCPAPENTLLNTAGLGVSTDCSLTTAPSGTTDTGSGNDRIRIGMIPTRSLDLPDSYAFDAWNNRIAYSVVAGLAQTNALYNSYTTVTSTSEPIIVNDENGNPRYVANNSVNSPNIIAYIIMSYGRMGAGATNYTGTGINLACGTSLESANCNGGNVFVDAPHNYTAGATYYDDYVVWRTLSSFDSEVNYLGLSNSPIVDIAIITDRFNPMNENEPWAAAGLNSLPLRTISGNTAISGLTLNKSAGTTSVGSNGGTSYDSQTLFPTSDTDGVLDCLISGGCSGSYDQSSFTLPVGTYNINAMGTYGYDFYYPGVNTVTNTAGTGSFAITSGGATIWGFPADSVMNSGGLALSQTHVPVNSYWSIGAPTSFGLRGYSSANSRMGWAGQYYGYVALQGWPTSDHDIVPQTYYVEIWKH
ncbi:MAG: type II secretion system protein [Rickettsiales bacterium]